MAMLECKHASSREIAARRRDDSAYGIEAVAARYECCRRLEAQVTATEMHVFLRHVRWVCDDQRERLPRNALKPVGFDESCIADAQSLRIAPRERDRGRRNVGTDDAGARSLVRDRQCDRARAATEIERRGRRLLVERGQRQLDQQFRLRARNQNVGSDLELEPEKFATAGEISDWLAVAAAARQHVVGEHLFARERSIAVRCQPRAIAIHDVREQELGLEWNEAAHGQCS